MIQWILAIWSLLPLYFLNPAWLSSSLFWVINIIFVQFFYVFLPLFLLPSASFRSTSFLSFIVPIFAWNIPWYLTFLKRPPIFCIQLFTSISLHWLLRKAFLSLLFFFALELCIQIGIPFLLSFSFHFCSFLTICKATSDNLFAFLHLFSLGMVLITSFCTMSWTFIHSSFSILSSRSNPLNLFVTSTV